MTLYIIYIYIYNIIYIIYIYIYDMYTSTYKMYIQRREGFPEGDIWSLDVMVCPDGRAVWDVAAVVAFTPP